MKIIKHLFYLTSIIITGILTIKQWIDINLLGKYSFYETYEYQEYKLLSGKNKYILTLKEFIPEITLIILGGICFLLICFYGVYLQKINNKNTIGKYEDYNEINTTKKEIKKKGIFTKYFSITISDIKKGE